jgi:hypothetical protein
MFEPLEGRRVLAVDQPFLLGLTLVNATTDKPIIAFTPDINVNLDDIGTNNLSVRADSYGTGTESVRFGLDDNPNFRTENLAPYTLAGDSGGTDYLAWIATPGVHTITATPFSGDNATGTAGQTIKVQFHVLDDVTPTWKNNAFTAQTGQFTAEFDASADRAGTDAVVGLSKGNASSYDHLAAIVRFNEAGTIDARNGNTYAAAAQVAYEPGTKYHFRMVVDVAKRQYDVYVTPAGGSEVLLANDFAFRSSQSGVTSLNNWATFNRLGDVSVSNFKVTASQPPTDSSYSVVLNSATANAGDRMTVNWMASGNVTTADWIGLFKVGADNSSFVWWQYTDGKASGTATFTAPATAGNYEVRYFVNDGFTSVAASAPLTVTAPQQPPTGSERPGPDNTGPTNPSILQSYTGIYRITTNGAVVENIDVNGQIYIDADNVTLRNFRVNGSIPESCAVYVARGRKGTVIEDGEITASAYWVAGLGADWFTARRLHIHNVHDGINLGDGAVVENCYIHSLGEGGGGHSDGIQAVLSVWPVTIRNNFIDASYVTAAINNVNTNWIVEGNTLYGAFYTIYFNPSGSNPIVRNNRFGGEGAAQRFAPSGTIWEGNVWDATGEPILL